MAGVPPRPPQQLISSAIKKRPAAPPPLPATPGSTPGPGSNLPNSSSILGIRPSLPAVPPKSKVVVTTTTRPRPSLPAPNLPPTPGSGGTPPQTPDTSSLSSHTSNSNVSTHSGSTSTGVVRPPPPGHGHRQTPSFSTPFTAPLTSSSTHPPLPSALHRPSTSSTTPPATPSLDTQHLGTGLHPPGSAPVYPPSPSSRGSSVTLPPSPPVKESYHTDTLSGSQHGLNISQNGPSSLTSSNHGLENSLSHPTTPEKSHSNLVSTSPTTPERDQSFPWLKTDRKKNPREETEVNELWSKTRARVMLSNTIRIYSEKPENRFANDFLPPKPKSDQLAASALESFSAPTKNIVRVRSQYKSVPPKKAKQQEYDIDILYEKSKTVGKRKKKKEKAGILDLFAPVDQPGDDKSAENKQNPDGQDHDEKKDDDDDEDDLPSQPEEVDIKSLVDVKLIQQVDMKNAQISIQEEQKAAGQDTDGLFSRFQPDYNYTESKEETICGRKVAIPFWQRDFGLQFLVHCKKCVFSLGQIEPFFCTLALYDLKKRIRLSENFHFDLNDGSLLAGGGMEYGVVQLSKSMADPITLARHAIFSVSDRHDQLYMILKVERVLQGDPSEIEKEYMKNKPRTKAELDALIKKAKQATIYLSDYRQTFGWGMWKIFDEDLELRDEGKTMRVDKIFFQAESLNDRQMIALAQEVVQDGGRKLKQYPASHFEFFIKELDTDMPPNRVDPSSISLKDTQGIYPIESEPNINPTPPTTTTPTKDEKKNDPTPQGGQPVVKEVLEFVDYSTTLQAIPNTYFVNLLYVYPEFITFQKFRNISCKVQVRNSDAKVVGDGLKVILGKSSTSTWTNAILTQVNYHKKTCTPQDEVKILLPPDMSPSYHLFFTFYKVSCKKRPGKREAVGYSVLPLFNRNRMVQDGLYSLTVTQKLSKSYIAPYQEGKVPMFYLPEQHSEEESRRLVGRHQSQQCLNVRIKLVSSIFNQDNALNDFFQIFPSTKELHGAGSQKARVLLEQAVGQIPKAHPVQLVRFLCPLMEFLWKVIAFRDRDDTKYYGFIGLAYLVHSISEYFGEQGRCNLLMTYVNHRFENLPGTKPLYLIISDLWLLGLSAQVDRETEKDTHEERLLVQHAWFFFETIFKSMALEFTEKGSLVEEDQKIIVVNLAKTMRIFVCLMHRHRSTGLTSLKHLISNLALFFNDLHCVLDKQSVLYLITTFVHEFQAPDYVQNKTDPVLVEFKFIFYSILFDSEYIIALNEPEPLDIKGDVIAVITSKYQLPSLMLDDFAVCLNLKEEQIREKVVDTVRLILSKFDYDSKHQHQKADIALMFFPLVPSVMRKGGKVKEWGSKTQRLLLVSFMWILKNLERQKLRYWWKTVDPPEDLADFVLLLDLAVQIFQYMGIKHRENDAEFKSILSPESIGSFVEPGSAPAAPTDLKQGIETMMGNIHRDTAQNHRSAKAIKRSQGQDATNTLRRLRQTLQKNRGTYKRGAAQSTLTQTHREYLIRLVRWEGALSQNVSRIVLSVALDFLEDHHSLLDLNPAPLLLQRFTILFTSLLATHQTTKFLESFYPLLRLFITRYGTTLFRTENLADQMLDFVGQVFRHLTFNAVNIRSSSLSTVYLLLTRSFAAEKKLQKLQEMLTVSLSKLIPELDSYGESNLQSSLQALPLFAQQALPFEKFSPETLALFNVELKTLLTRLLTILGDSMEISRQKKLADNGDPTTIEHLLLQVATANSHMPDVRIQWLSQLAEHHASRKNYAESGQCFLAIADLFIDQQKMIQFGPTKAYESLDSALEAFYESATMMLDKAELYEQCNEVYKLLVPIYEKRKDYKKLSTAYFNLHQIYEKLLDAELKQSRMLGTYYRVGFYGTKFGPRLDGNEFIYKMPKITRLPEIAAKMKQLYSTQLEQEVTILPDSGPVDKSKLNPKDCVLQITFVNPEFCTDAKDGYNYKRDCFIEQNFKIRSFKYSTPFAAPGKRKDDLKYRQQRNTILRVEAPFPYVKTAQRVVLRDESIFSPIESAADDVMKRVEKMIEVLSTDPVSSKRLSALIGGSLLPLVNGGVNQICDAFLIERPEGEDDDDGLTKEERTRQRALLRKVMREFIDACKRALDVNKGMSMDDEKALLFHNEVASKFDILCDYLQPLIYEQPRGGVGNSVAKKPYKAVTFSSSTPTESPTTPGPSYRIPGSPASPGNSFS